MKEFKGTKGEWKVTPNINTLIQSDGNRSICSTGNWIDGKIETELENESNAQLISAAPKMLEALQSFVENYKTSYDMVTPFKLAHAAINKALGSTEI